MFNTFTRSESGNSIFPCELQLTTGLSRITQPRVDVAGILAGEDGGAVLGALEGEGGALEDGRAHRADGFLALVLVEVLLAVNAEGGEAVVMGWRAHERPPFFAVRPRRGRLPLAAVGR